MSFELQKIITKYMSKDFPLNRYQEDDKLVDCLFKMIFEGRINQYDCPDMYGIFDNDVYLVEHFEYDSSKKLKNKGSEFRIEEARANRDFEALPYTDGFEELYTDVLNVQQTKKDYFRNFESGFDEHYGNIERYKEHLKNDGIINSATKDVHTGFIIEDVTCLGSIFIDGMQNSPLILLRLKQFLDKFEASPYLDFVLFGFFYSQDYYLCFISQKTLCEARKQEVDLDKIEVHFFETQTAGFKYILHDDRKDDDE